MVEYKNFKIFEKDGVYTIGGENNVEFSDCTLENLSPAIEEFEMVKWCRNNNIKLQFIDLRNPEQNVSYEGYLGYLQRYKLEPDLSFTEYQFIVPTALFQSEGQAKNFIDWLDLELSGIIEQHRIVLTCFDSNLKVSPVADSYENLFYHHQTAYKEAYEMAQRECRALTIDLPPSFTGCFEIDDCANNDFEVRWYEKNRGERDESSCDIEYVTTYNIYPVLYNTNNHFYSYRGFNISSTKDQYYHSHFEISHKDNKLETYSNIDQALSFVDKVCLECAKDKTVRLDAINELPYNILSKYVSIEQVNNKNSNIESNIENNLINAMVQYGLDNSWNDSEVIDALVDIGITQEDFQAAGMGDFVKEYFEEETTKPSLISQIQSATDRNSASLPGSVISVAHLTEDEIIKKFVIESDALRKQTLDICYKIPGYLELPKEDKNSLYDLVKKSVSLCMEKSIFPER